MTRPPVPPVDPDAVAADYWRHARADIQRLRQAKHDASVAAAIFITHHLAAVATQPLDAPRPPAATVTAMQLLVGQLPFPGPH